MRVRASELDHRLRIERPVAGGDFDAAGAGTWATVDEIWASVVDDLPSRTERPADGFTTAMRTSRVRMYHRADLTAAMRFVDISDGADGRIMQIVSPPATLGRRAGVEVMVEDYSPAGNPA